MKVGALPVTQHFDGFGIKADPNTNLRFLEHLKRSFKIVRHFKHQRER